MDYKELLLKLIPKLTDEEIEELILRYNDEIECQK